MTLESHRDDSGLLTLAAPAVLPYPRRPVVTRGWGRGGPPTTASPDTAKGPYYPSNLLAGCHVIQRERPQRLRASPDPHPLVCGPQSATPRAFSTAASGGVALLSRRGREGAGPVCGRAVLLQPTGCRSQR